MDPRIGDAEREVATSRLGDHFAAGRLDHEEYDERLDAIWSARTRADLDQLFWDLPRAVAPVAPARGPLSARRGPVVPSFVPVVVIGILVAVAVLKAAPWVLLIAAAWLLFFRPRRRRMHGPSGRAGRGTRSCA
ncbi:DUF1707 domain-containing protein [Nocardioides sp.]|uniref:DUF1707 SHOCT-like domain-containing protein n=1 Tax=Nocardioides sp. TaxID=35761 RepID=UPI00286E2ABE|nr:DUF1707 domain-containing protein [Nocardioides sp.]